MKKLIRKILREEQDLEWAKDLVNAEVRPSRSLVLRKQKELPKNAIELHTETMHGDGDKYDNHKIIFYRDAKGMNSTDRKSIPNFEDFERVVEFLRDGGVHTLTDEHGDQNDELAEYFINLGCIDYSEYGDEGFEMATVEEIFYYDENGIKYDAHIDGLNSRKQDDDDEDNDDDEFPIDDEDEDNEDSECQVCGVFDDTGEGICSDCQLDRADEDASYTQ